MDAVLRRSRGAEGTVTFHRAVHKAKLHAFSLLPREVLKDRLERINEFVRQLIGGRSGGETDS